MKTGIKVNLGSGTNRRQDYVSVDYYIDEVDIKHDIRNKLPFDDESVFAIYLCHVIEHFSYEEIAKMVKDWGRVLQTGGSVEIRCPDLIKACQQFIDNPDDLFNKQVLYGIQTTPGEFHKNGFTEDSLRKLFGEGWVGTVLMPSSDYELHMEFTKLFINNIA